MRNGCLRFHPSGSAADPCGGRRSAGCHHARVEHGDARPGSLQRHPTLPVGQHIPDGWPVLHYGRVPRYDPETWDLRVTGAIAGGEELRLDRTAFDALPRTDLVADLHCVTGFTIPDRAWSGVPAVALLDLAPPAPGVEHVLLWAEYGYSTNVALDDLLRPDALLATHCGGEPLTPEHGWPLRLVLPHLYGWKGPKWLRAVEYLDAPRPGFWEQRGYHRRGRVDRQERYSHQEA